MADVAILIPVLGRPERALPVALSALASEAASTLELVFLCSPGDIIQINACERACVLADGTETARASTVVVPFPRLRGDFARKQNLGLHITDAPYVFCGADDLVFHPGWADAAISVVLEQDVCFVATNDLGNPTVMAGTHATHPLVCRDYAVECGTIDTPGLIYHEGYWHQYVDNEATGTAKYRECFGFAKDSVVEHMHPIWGKAERDETYRIGDEHRNEDRDLWRARRSMWGER